MDKIIHCKVKLNCNVQHAFDLFTVNEQVKTWLAADAHIEPHVGGAYELFWDLKNKTNNSTIGCKITAIDSNKLLCFEWKGPVQFSDFMNMADPLTHVTIAFIPETADTVEVQLIHTGWRSGENWDAARTWFEHVWTNVLENLRNNLLP